MKNLMLIFIVISSFKTFSQTNDNYRNMIKELKANSTIDKNDLSVLNLMDDFYQEVLQSDKGELSQKTSIRMKKMLSDKTIKNNHLLKIFMIYQNYINYATNAGKQPNSKFQVDIIKDLENEINSIFGYTPIIIQIYKAEALNSDGQKKEASLTISDALLKFPNSIPLKVYSYLDNKNEFVKKDLIENHSNHWMVKQFGIN